MAEKPRLLVIAGAPEAGRGVSSTWADQFEVVSVCTITEAIALLRQGPVAGIFVDASRLPRTRWSSALLQANEVLDTINEGVAIVTPDHFLIWANAAFTALAVPGAEIVGGLLEHTLGFEGEDADSVSRLLEAPTTEDVTVHGADDRWLRLSASPVREPDGRSSHVIVLIRDVTLEALQEQKVAALHDAGEELADLTPEDLAILGDGPRKEILRQNIVRHMKELLGLDFIQVRCRERGSNRLVPLLTEGMTPLANRELHASEVGQGVTGHVAATGRSYLCRDTTTDPLYLEGAAGARSSLTVPLPLAGSVIGTLNVESPHSNAFDDWDRRLLEIYARSLANAINTFDLLDAEKRNVTSESVEAFQRVLALPVDAILADATAALDGYAGPDSEITSRLQMVVARSREVRDLIARVSSNLKTEVTTEGSPSVPQRPQRLVNARVLVADAEEGVRQAAHLILTPEGAVVETARTAREAVALAKQTIYSTAIVDIRLPDLPGYETFSQLRAARPGLPVILMTGFGYDPTHAIVKARQDGLQTALYKPFRADRLVETVEQVLRAGNHAP